MSLLQALTTPSPFPSPRILSSGACQTGLDNLISVVSGNRPNPLTREQDKCPVPPWRGLPSRSTRGPETPQCLVSSRPPQLSWRHLPKGVSRLLARGWEAGGLSTTGLRPGSVRAHHGPALQRGHPAGHLSALPQTVVQAVPKASSGLGASGHTYSVSLGVHQPEAGLALGPLGPWPPQDSAIRLRAAHARPVTQDWGRGPVGPMLSGLWE